jgi:hypothetical protein
MDVSLTNHALHPYAPHLVRNGVSAKSDHEEEHWDRWLATSRTMAALRTEEATRLLH